MHRGAKRLSVSKRRCERNQCSVRVNHGYAGPGVMADFAAAKPPFGVLDLIELVKCSRTTLPAIGKRTRAPRRQDRPAGWHGGGTGLTRHGGARSESDGGSSFLKPPY